MEKNRNTKQSLIQNILIAALTLLVAAFGIMYFSEKRKNIQKTDENTELTITKDSLEGRLVEMIYQYDSLKTNHREINEQLLVEKQKVVDLLTNLRNERSYSRSKISEYEKELGTMRKIMQSYIVQIDSLNQSNIALRAENKDVRQRIQQVTTQKEEMTKKYEDASVKVGIASALRAIKISGEGMSKRERDITRARNIDKFKVCFTLDQNHVAPAGNRYVYLKITRPDNILIENSAKDVIIIDEQLVVYSARREVDYQQEAIDVCIFAEANGEMPKGTYKIELFADNRSIGKGTMSFK